MDAAANAQSLADASLAISVRMDEHSTVSFVITANSSATPSASEVFMGVGSRNSTVATAGSFDAPASSRLLTNATVPSLDRGAFYCVHMAAVDVVGNRQASVTSIW